MKIKNNLISKIKFVIIIIIFCIAVYISYGVYKENKIRLVEEHSQNNIQVKKVGGSSNHKYVKLRIEFAIREGRLTDVQENYLQRTEYADNMRVALWICGDDAQHFANHLVCCK